MEGAYSLIDRVFRRTCGAGLHHFGEEAGLFVIQRNRHSAKPFHLPQYRILRRLSRKRLGVPRVGTIINDCYCDRGADSSAETCTYGSQPSGSGSVVLHHFAPPLNQAALSVLVDVFASWYPNSVPQQGQMLNSDGGSSIP